jgi:hypothetical protein
MITIKVLRHNVFITNLIRYLNLYCEKFLYKVNISVLRSTTALAGISGFVFVEAVGHARIRLVQIRFSLAATFHGFKSDISDQFIP